MRISQIPRGLLNLLGIQQGGLTIPDMADSLVPTIDASYMYMAANQELLGSGSAIGAGFTAYQQVPLNEVWILLGAHIESSQIVGESGVACLAEQSPNNPGNTRLILSSYIGSAAAVAGTTLRMAMNWEPGYQHLLTAGTQIGCYAPAAPSGGSAWTVGVKIVRLKTGA